MYESRFFLGANTKNGFISRFDELRNLQNYRHQYIIKGCPGSGKSTFMRKIAHAAAKNGFRVEQILCSSDAESLDGVIIHDLGLSFADGTAPHIVEPRYPGVNESYIDFSPYWNTHGLLSVGREIKELDARIKSCYRCAYGYLKCAGIYENMLFDSVQVTRTDELHRRITGLISRELPKQKKTVKPGSRFVRFLSGYTPQGYLTCMETVYAMCDRVIGLADDFGIASAVLKQCADAAVAAGFDVFDCIEPLYGEHRTEHLLIPALRLGFVSMKRDDKRFAVNKRINLNPYVCELDFGEEQRHMKCLRSKQRECVLAGTEQIAKAKTYHDLLEQTYRPHIDFSGIDALTQKWIEELDLV